MVLNYSSFNKHAIILTHVDRPMGTTFVVTKWTNHARWNL